MAMVAIAKHGVFLLGVTANSCCFIPRVIKWHWNPEDWQKLNSTIKKDNGSEQRWRLRKWLRVRTLCGKEPVQQCQNTKTDPKTLQKGKNKIYLRCGTVATLFEPQKWNIIFIPNLKLQMFKQSGIAFFLSLIELTRLLFRTISIWSLCEYSWHVPVLSDISSPQNICWVCFFSRSVGLWFKTFRKPTH